jgi:uncharacterized protein YraI
MVLDAYNGQPLINPFNSNDFNRDSLTDILWRNAASGENVVWLMNGSQHVGDFVVERVGDTSWKIVGTGDFDQDGNADIVWRNSVSGDNVIWKMNGGNHVGDLIVDKVADQNWQIVGAADFDRDGKVDLLWRNFVSGENLVWRMNSGQHIGDLRLDQVTDRNWRIVGISDFDQDGKVDLLWRNSMSGDNLIWLMNGAAHVSDLSIDRVSDLSWQIVSTADFDKNGTTDLLWRNSVSGETLIWQMNRNGHIGDMAVERVQDTNWKISGAGSDNSAAIPLNQFRTEYYNNNSLSGQPAFTRIENSVNVNWGLGGPDNRVGNDNFSVRWTGRFDFDGGIYQFSSSVDDGMRIWVDGNLIHDTWAARNSVDYTKNVLMPAGQHDVKIEYREDGILALAKVSWAKGGESYADAINRVGGSQVVGNAINQPHTWGGGEAQDFTGGAEGRGILMKRDGTNTAYWISGDVWEKYYAVEVASSGLLKYPTSDRYAFNGGWKQDFRGGSIVKDGQGVITAFSSALGSAILTVPEISARFQTTWQSNAAVLGAPLPENRIEKRSDGSYQKLYENGYLLWDKGRVSIESYNILTIPGQGVSPSYSELKNVDANFQSFWQSNSGRLGPSVGGTERQADGSYQKLYENSYLIWKNGQVSIQSYNNLRLPQPTPTLPIQEIYLPNDPRNPNYKGTPSNGNNSSAIQPPPTVEGQNPPANDGRSGDFDGIVKIDGLRVRTGPGTGFSTVGLFNTGNRMTFDRWENGTSHYDPQARAWDSRWFRIKNTNNWVASAYINGNPGSTPTIVIDTPNTSKIDNGNSDTASKDPSTNLKPAPQDPLRPETSPQIGGSGKGSLPSYMISSFDIYQNIPDEELENLKSDSAAASTTWKFKNKYGDNGAKEMLNQYQNTVIQAAKFYGIDGRAIAGAIRWEYEENSDSRKRDYFWYIDTIFDGIRPWFGKGVGWGKMHFTAASALLAREGQEFDDSHLAVLLALAPTSIELIAKYMREAANIYQKFAGIDISYRPEILATLYQGVSTDEDKDKDPFINIEIRAKELAEKRKLNPNQQPQPNEKMGAWLVKHLNELTAYK